MKKIIYGVLLYSSFFFSSCSKEENGVNPSEKENLSNYVTPTGESIFTTFVANDGKTYSITKYDLSRIKPSSKKILSTIVPKTVNGQLTKIKSNHRVVIQYDSHYTPGVYFGDLYTSEATVTVPSGSFALYSTSTGPSVRGFYDPNNPIDTSNSSLEGSTSTQNSNTYKFTTYSFVPMYNSSGINVANYALPRDLTSNVFSYSEYTP